MKLFLSLVCTLIVGQLSAQIVTDRPDQTESSKTVGGGNLQVEMGFFIGYEGEPSNEQVLVPTTLIRYGLASGIELRLLSQFESTKLENDKINGISDPEVGVKFNILNKAVENIEIAFLSHLVIPRGSAELSGKEYGTINKLAISHTLSETLSLGYNVGYNYLGEGDGDLTYSIALGKGINDKAGVYIEPYGELVNFNEWITNIDTGFTYLADENLQFDFSFGTGLDHRMNYIAIGASWLLVNNLPQ